MSSSGSGNNHQNVQRCLQNSKDPSTSNKVSKDAGFVSRFHRDRNSSADCLENTFPFAVRSSVQVPSPDFQFEVSSEDGIQLFVDLNSNPFDWIESLKNGVHVCSNMHKIESPNYHHKIGWRCCCKQTKGSSLVNSYEEVDNGDVNEESHPATTGMGALPESNEHNKAEGSLSSPRRNLEHTAHCQEHFGEEQTTTSSRPESDAEKQVSGGRFHTRQGIMSADLSTDVFPGVKTCNNSPRYSLPSFAKRSKVLESNNINMFGDIYSHRSLQQMNDPPDLDVVCTGVSTSPPREMRESCSNTFDQDRVGVCQDFTCQPKSYGTEHFEQSNGTKKQCTNVTDHTTSASPSGLINGHSSDPTNMNQDKVGFENNKASTSNEYDQQILDTQRHQTGNQNGTSLFPLHNHESGEVYPTSSIKIDCGFMQRSHEATQQAVEMHSCLDDVWRNEALLSSCSNSASSSFVAPEQNGADRCTPPDFVNNVQKSSEVLKALKRKRKSSQTKTIASSSEAVGNLTNPLALTRHEHVVRYNKLLKREIKPTRVMCKTTLTKLGLLDDVIWLFERLGMRKLLEIDDYTYENLTLEFLSSVQVDINKFHGQGWGVMTFRMQGVNHILTIDQLNEAFSLPTGLHKGSQQTAKQYNRDEFWRRISTSSAYDSSGSSTKCIRHPALRVAHKFLAFSVFGRDETHGVRCGELYLLWGMLENYPIDIGSHLAMLFIHVRKAKGPIVVGSLIAHLAVCLGFDPGQHMADCLHPPELVGTSILARMGIIRSYNGKWHWIYPNDYPIPITEQPCPTVKDIDNLAYDPSQFRSPTPPTTAETDIPSSQPSSSDFDFTALHNMVSGILCGQENLQRSDDTLLPQEVDVVQAWAHFGEEDKAAIRTAIAGQADYMRLMVDAINRLREWNAAHGFPAGMQSGLN